MLIMMMLLARLQGCVQLFWLDFFDLGVSARVCVVPTEIKINSGIWATLLMRKISLKKNHLHNRKISRKYLTIFFFPKRFSSFFSHLPQSFALLSFALLHLHMIYGKCCDTILFSYKTWICSNIKCSYEKWWIKFTVSKIHKNNNNKENI